jgi:hypothetical protein
MTTPSFTLADLARTLREVAAERPDHVYANPRNPTDGYCEYLHADGEPGCIFGVALSRLGVDLASLGNMAIGQLLANWFGDSEYDASYKPFTAVQYAQDGSTLFDRPRKPWGEAVKALDAHYPAVAS